MADQAPEITQRIQASRMMTKQITLAFSASMLVAAPAFAQDEEEKRPVIDFLVAADKADTEGMKAAMNPDRGVSASKLMNKIEGCYLRRVRGGGAGQAIAVWMCAEGEDKSRLVFTEVSRSNDGAVVQITMERKGDLPAPQREGSALEGSGL